MIPLFHVNMRTIIFTEVLLQCCMDSLNAMKFNTLRALEALRVLLRGMGV